MNFLTLNRMMNKFSLILAEHDHDHEGHDLIEELGENLSFILVALVVTIAIILLSKLIESIVVKKAGVTVEKRWTAKRIAGVGLFSAVGGALALFEIPLTFIVPGFYLLDFSEVAGMMAAFLLGPVAGVLVEFIKTIIHILIHGTHSAFIGDFGAFVMGTVFILPASLIYLTNKTRKRALLGLITSTFVLAAFGAAFNALYLIPTFAKLYGMDMAGIIAMGTAINPAIKDTWSFIGLATVPFNLIKGVAVSVIVFFIYKPLSTLYRKIH